MVIHLLTFYVSTPGAYFCLNMILITLSSFLSVIVINIYHRADKKNHVPEWLQRVRVFSHVNIIKSIQSQ